MSFILDALKKSEIERQRQSVPGLIDTRLSPKRSRLPLWAVAVCVLLGINLLALTYVLLRKSAPAAQASHPVDAAIATGSPGTAASTAAAQPETQPFSPLDSTPQYAPEIPVASQAGGEPREPAPAHKADTESRAAAATPRTVRPPAEADAAPEEVLPTISEVSLAGSQALPDLHLDVHVYATNPAERFVYINMRKYHEGAKLQEGPTVERIRRDGVVLSYQGVRFLLPRQP